MIDSLLSLIVILIVAGLLYWAAMKIAAAFGMPAPIVTLIQVAIVVVACLMILGTFRVDGHAAPACYSTVATSPAALHLALRLAGAHLDRMTSDTRRSALRQ